jgi:hypothetical protein
MQIRLDGPSASGWARMTTGKAAQTRTGFKAVLVLSVLGFAVMPGFGQSYSPFVGTEFEQSTPSRMHKSVWPVSSGLHADLLHELLFGDQCAHTLFSDCASKRSYVKLYHGFDRPLSDYDHDNDCGARGICRGMRNHLRLYGLRGWRSYLLGFRPWRVDICGSETSTWE